MFDVVFVIYLMYTFTCASVWCNPLYFCQPITYPVTIVLAISFHFDKIPSVAKCSSSVSFSTKRPSADKLFRQNDDYWVAGNCSVFISINVWYDRIIDSISSGLHEKVSHTSIPTPPRAMTPGQYDRTLPMIDEEFEVMAWCLQPISHYQSQHFPSSM